MHTDRVCKIGGLRFLPLLPRFEPSDPTHKSFRDDLLPRYQAAVTAKGTPPEDVARMTNHVDQRDYPLSHEEMARVLKAAGLEARSHRYDNCSAEPLKDVYSVVVAWPR